MVRRLSVAAALWLLAAAGPAQAMGLGDIKVKSSLNQRFSASIPFTSLTPEEAANVRAQLADHEAFQRAGLERSAYVGSIQIEALTEGPNPRLELSSKELAREPLITLLVEVRTPGGMRMFREYTVLLDPAVTAATMSQSAASSEFFQTPEEVRGGARSGEPEKYGPVGPTETLWMVAQAVKPAGVSLDQAMLALFESNRGAFRGGDIDALRKGSVLDVPSAERMQAVSSATARARVLELSAQDQGTTVSKTTPFSSGEAPAPRKSTPPPAPAVAAAAPVTPPASETPAPATPATPAPDGVTGTSTTEPTTPATGEAAAPATGEGTAPDATTSTEATATPSTEAPAGESTAATTAGAEGAAPADAAAAEESEAASGWISTLIPILIGLIVLLIGFLVWRSARERKAQREYENAAREASTAMPAPRVGAQGSVGARAAQSARAELEALDRQIDDDATRIAGGADDDATRMVTTSKIPPYTGPQAADRQMDEAEQAVTNQFQANTKEIKLGDNDPLSEADFHLAYGLYDEAALLLQQASARAPQRTDLRIKLAETYFAAGKPAEFEQVASGLKGEVGDEEWGKLAILGRQIAPASALFQGDDAAAGADTVLDINFDDDATQIAPVKVDEGLEFRLEELELPTKADTAAGSRGPAVEFDLGEFDLSGTDGKRAGAKPPAASPEMSLKDFDLGGSDLAGPGKSDLDVRLEEVEPMLLDDPAQDAGPVSATDDAATKLDLARAYVEMGDAEMARGLLDEVAKVGTDDQKREAGALRERLLG